MTLKERARKILPYVGYPVFYLVSLFAFAVWTFPYDKLRDRIVTSFNAEQRKAPSGGQELQIGDLGSSWVTGVRMTDVRLVSPPSAPDAKPGEIRIDEATARISLLSLIVGTRRVTFHVKGLGGEVEGAVAQSGTSREVEVTLDGVDIGQIGPLRDALGLPMEGKASGTVTLAMPEGKAAKTNGAINLDVRDVAVGDGKAKLKGALALPRLVVGTLAVVGEAKDGVLKISKVAAGGKDVELQGDGRVQMRELATESLLDLNVKFKVNDAYRTKSDVTKSLFGAPGSNIPALFEMDPKVKKAKREDGFYAFHARGSLGRPDFEPAR